MSEFITNLQELLILHEGKRNKLYVDTVGRTTGGVGHNFSDNGISDHVILIMLEEDIEEVQIQVENNFPQWMGFNEARLLVVHDMIFNMGINKFQGFKKMIEFLNVNDFDKAADEMLDSTWAKQVGARATRLAEMMRSGTLPKELL